MVAQAQRDEEFSYAPSKMREMLIGPYLLPVAVAAAILTMVLTTSLNRAFVVTAGCIAGLWLARYVRAYSWRFPTAVRVQGDRVVLGRGWDTLELSLEDVVSIESSAPFWTGQGLYPWTRVALRPEAPLRGFNVAPDMQRYPQLVRLLGEVAWAGTKEVNVRGGWSLLAAFWQYAQLAALYGSVVVVIPLVNTGLWYAGVGAVFAYVAIGRVVGGSLHRMVCAFEMSADSISCRFWWGGRASWPAADVISVRYGCMHPLFPLGSWDIEVVFRDGKTISLSPYCHDYPRAVARLVPGDA